MRITNKLAILLILVIGVSSCGESDQTAPRVLKTEPQNGDKNVDPNTREMTVTFDERMMDQSWSWAYTEQSRFPDITGQAYYTKDFKVNVLPVTMAPNTEYEVWVNSQKHQGFKDIAGNSAVPYKLVFKTR